MQYKGVMIKSPLPPQKILVEPTVMFATWIEVIHNDIGYNVWNGGVLLPKF